ncbi:MAG: hypothetical protein RL308_1100 [Bacteroidota bacterium]|jgi:hypothetical protein
MKSTITFVIFIFFLSVFGFTQPCDTIILRDRLEIPSIIEEIRLNEISYRKCEFLDGPVYIIDKEKVYLIKYKNGDSEIINTTSTIDLIESDPYSRLETVFFSNLLGEEKKKLIDSKECFKVIMNDKSSFIASITKFKTMSTVFVICPIDHGNLINNNDINYIETNNGRRIFFNK